MEGSTRVSVAFDQHSTEYRAGFPGISHELRQRAPAVWSKEHGGYWVVTGRDLLGEMAKHPELFANDHDPRGERHGYRGVAIPPPPPGTTRGGFLEMDAPEHMEYRRVLNPFLSPAAVERWRPLVNDMAHACLDEIAERGRLDFVDDLANVVPAVLTMGMLGLPLDDWTIFCEPAHAMVYTPPQSPAYRHVLELTIKMYEHVGASLQATRERPRRGMIKALLDAQAAGAPLVDDDIQGTIVLLIGGGFDTTTALTAHALDWLDRNPAEKPRLLKEPGLLDTATEEFVRWATPAQGGGRTVTRDCEIGGFRFRAGERVWMAYGLANHDGAAFPDPDDILLGRLPNRHAAFGLGVHRCIGSNLARMSFKTMLTAVLERIPGDVGDRSGIVRYEDIGTINGYQHLPARFEPAPRRGDPLAAVMARWQERLDDGSFWG